MSIWGKHKRVLGHDRMYLTRDDGTLLGWVDELTGEIHVEAEAYLLEIRAWIADRGER